MRKGIRIREIATGRSDLLVAEVVLGDGTYAPLELASETEAATGTDANRLVTPQGLAAAATGLVAAASTTEAGKVELATSAEAITGTDEARAVTPKALADSVPSHVPAASTSVAGKIELASNAEAIAGALPDRAITPVNLLQGAPTIANSTLKPAFAVEYRIAPALGASASIHAAITMPEADTLEVTTAITQPDFPRVLSVKGNAAGITGNVVIDGTDAGGTVIQDTIALSDDAIVAGAKAFKTVTKITVPTRNAEGNTVEIGSKDIFGMPQVVYNAGYLLVNLFDGADDAGGSLAVSATLSLNLYTTAGTPNNAKVLALVYLV